MAIRRIPGKRTAGKASTPKPMVHPGLARRVAAHKAKQKAELLSDLWPLLRAAGGKWRQEYLRREKLKAVDHADLTQLRALFAEIAEKISAQYPGSLPDLAARHTAMTNAVNYGPEDIPDATANAIATLYCAIVLRKAATPIDVIAKLETLRVDACCGGNTFRTNELSGAMMDSIMCDVTRFVGAGLT